MDQSTATALLLAFLGLLAVAVSVVSVLILKGGRFYQRIPEKSRPRQLVVGFFFSYFVTFCLWFPLWAWHRGTIAAHVLGFIFGAFTFVLAAVVVLGRVGVILTPVVIVVARLVEIYKIGREGKRPKNSSGT
jgi:hypothetical protein